MKTQPREQKAAMETLTVPAARLVRLRSLAYADSRQGEMTLRARGAHIFAISIRIVLSPRIASSCSHAHGDRSPGIEPHFDKQRHGAHQEQGVKRRVDHMQ